MIPVVYIVPERKPTKANKLHVLSSYSIHEEIAEYK